MNENFQPLKYDEEDKDAVIAIGDYFMIKVGDLMKFALTIFRNPGLSNLMNEITKQGRGSCPSTMAHSNFINTGIQCQIMKPGKAWQKGVFRLNITLEFCPDEVEDEIEENPGKLSNESLDGLRQQLNLSN